MADVYKQSFKQNYTNNIELSIFNCGLERCAPGQTWGPGIRDHYLIHLVVSGKGTFEVGGKTPAAPESTAAAVLPGVNAAALQGAGS